MFCQSAPAKNDEPRFRTIRPVEAAHPISCRSLISGARPDHLFHNC